MQSYAHKVNIECRTKFLIPTAKIQLALILCRENKGFVIVFIQEAELLLLFLLHINAAAEAKELFLVKKVAE